MFSIRKVLIPLVAVLTISSTQDADDLIVQLPEGKIRGHVLSSEKNADFYAFQEIPYAAPPTGKNRFMPPKDPLPWDGILNTTKNSKMCIQRDLFGGPPGSEKTEDCLFLNVYTPVKPGSAEKLPVFFWIHGGGFEIGSGSYDTYNPEYLMDFDIVVVTFNYRLGSVGFLSTLDGVITGNFALKDQRQALRWVNSHISLFGGDPTKVTVGGQSAGAHAVSYQLLGENAKGLFQGTIQESGSAAVVSTYQKHAIHYAYEVGKYLDPTFTTQNTSADLLDLVQKVSIDDYFAASQKVVSVEVCSTGYVDDMLWTPVIENNTDDPFLTTPMVEKFVDGSFNQVPTLLGFNSEESLGFILILKNKTWELAGEYDRNVSLLLTDRLNIPLEEVALAATELKQIYTNTSFSDDMGAFVRRSSDSGFTDGILRQAESTFKYVPTYLYIFSYPGDMTSSMYDPHGRFDIPGTGNVGHGEEMLYIWKQGTFETETDLLTQKRMLAMWTNFIKFSNPTPEVNDIIDVLWTPVQDSDLQYLNINDTLEIRSKPRDYKAVSDVLKKYVQPPYVVF